MYQVPNHETTYYYPTNLISINRRKELYLTSSSDTPAESVTSNQQSNPANLQHSDWNPDPKTGSESLSPEQGRTEQSADITATTDTNKKVLVSSISMPFEHLRRDMYASLRSPKPKHCIGDDPLVSIKAISVKPSRYES
jgi:hypothetical protein